MKRLDNNLLKNELNERLCIDIHVYHKSMIARKSKTEDDNF